MSCKGTCVSKYGAQHRTGGRGIFENGLVYCSTCRVGIKWDGIRCPCCSYKLRRRGTGTHALQARRKTAADMETRH